MSTMPELQTERVPLKSRIWVSAADAACAMLNTFVVSVGLTYYFTSWRGLDARLASIAWIIFGIWNAINDPLFGFISDRTRSTFGRRIPYIRFGAPIYAIAFLACWINWPGSTTNQWFMFAQMLVLLFLFDSLYTAIATSIYVMPFEMAISNRVRSTILVWKIILSIFPLAVPLVLWGFIKPQPGMPAGAFPWIMAGFGVVMAAIIFFSTFFYREKHYLQEDQQPPFFTALKECFKNLSFIIFEVISFTVIFVQTGLMLGLNYYLDELGVPGLPLYAALGAGIILGMVVFVNRRERWGIKNSLRIMALLFSLGCLDILLFGHLLIPAMFGFFCFGIGFAGGMYLIPLMNGDVIDKDEDYTGLRREGMYAGVNSFITKPAISLANAAFLWFIKLYGYDFTAAKGAQSASAEQGILMGWVLIPAILLFLSFVVLRWYPLAGDSWDRVKQRLELVHAKRERKYLAAQGLKAEE